MQSERNQILPSTVNETAEEEEEYGPNPIQKLEVSKNRFSLH